MSSKFSNIFLITVIILGLIFSPLALTEHAFAQVEPEVEPEVVAEVEES